MNSDNFNKLYNEITEKIKNKKIITQNGGGDLKFDCNISNDNGYVTVTNYKITPSENITINNNIQFNNSFVYINKLDEKIPYEHVKLLLYMLIHNNNAQTILCVQKNTKTNIKENDCVNNFYNITPITQSKPGDNIIDTQYNIVFHCYQKYGYNIYIAYCISILDSTIKINTILQKNLFGLEVLVKVLSLYDGNIVRYSLDIDDNTTLFTVKINDTTVPDIFNKDLTIENSNNEYVATIVDDKKKYTFGAQINNVNNEPATFTLNRNYEETDKGPYLIDLLFRN